MGGLFQHTPWLHVPSSPSKMMLSVKRTPSTRMPACKLLRNPGEPVALLRVFPVSQAVARTVQVREPSETCAVVGACSTQPKPGASGTARSTSTSAAMLSALLLLLPHFHPLLWPAATASVRCQSAPWFSTPLSRAVTRPQRL